MKRITNTLFGLGIFISLCAFSPAKPPISSASPIYLYGMAASFNDSLVYVTGIQTLDSVNLDKHGILPNLSLYSFQLTYYLNNVLGKPNFTSITYFSKDKAKLEKEANKLLSKYKKTNGVVLQDLSKSSFKYIKPE